MIASIFILAAFILLQSEIFAQETEQYWYRPEELRKKYSETVILDPLQHHGAATALSASWNDKFTVHGVVQGPLFAIATDGTNMYVGGQFTVAGGVAANNVAKWDGTKWSSIGTGKENGVNGIVEGIVFLNGKLYVGGQFNKAGLKSVNGVACWDGAAWQTLGPDSINGVRDSASYDGTLYINPGFVYSMGVHQNYVMIGGRFNLSGAVSTQGVAAWNTVTGAWTDMQGGLESPTDGKQVYAYTFASDGAGVYVGGKFDRVQNLPVHNLARWNGTGWSDVGGGADNWVMDATVDSAGHLYIGGYFDTVGTVQARGVARWNGSSWNGFGDGIDPDLVGYTPTVRAVRVIGGTVYAGGYFYLAGSTPVQSVARWNGSSWQAMAAGANNVGSRFAATVNVMEVLGTTLYVGGYQNSVDTISVGAVGAWEHTQSRWRSLNDGSAAMGIQGGYIMTMSKDKSGIIAAGDFRVAGGKYTNKIARWNGTQWSPIAVGAQNGVNGIVNDISTDGDTVYIGGAFSLAGTTQAFHAAYWNGTEWKSLGIGVGGVSGAQVNAVVKNGRYLYVGGNFSVVGDDENATRPAMSVARFHLDTRRWEALGGGIEASEGAPGVVNDLEFHNGDLYAGGFFSHAGNSPAKNIAMWRNGIWSPILTSDLNGLEGGVTSLVSTPEGITAGGRFTNIGMNISLARWNGIKWAPLASPIVYKGGQGVVLDVQYQDGRYFIGGQFDDINGVATTSLAMSGPDTWENFGASLNGAVYTVLPVQQRLFLGGTFTMAGGLPSVYVGEYTGIPTAVRGETAAAPSEFMLAQNYPNPFNPATTIRYQLSALGHTTIVVYDALGRGVATLVNEVKEPGSYTVRFDGSSLASGIYVARLTSNGRTAVRKLMLMK